MKRGAFILIGAAVLSLLVLGIYELGLVLECEFPFWQTLRIAEKTRVPDGRQVSDLVRLRMVGSSLDRQHWHHCTWCDVTYPHAPHMAVKVTINNDEKDFFLFDWDASQRKLLPITVRTAKAFPELIPSNCVVEPLGVGLNPQLYHNDEPCRIAIKQFGSLPSSGLPAFPSVDDAKLEERVGQNIELTGIVGNFKCPQVEGVDVWELDAYRGQRVRISGILRKEVVTQADINALTNTPDGSPLFANRGAGNFYHLENMKYEVLK